MFGVDDPVTLIDQRRHDRARFGDDFLGAGVSPVAAARQYARFRRGAPRGLLVQIEPKMTLTGANADRWIVIAPGHRRRFRPGARARAPAAQGGPGTLPPALIAPSSPTISSRGEPDHRCAGRSDSARRRACSGSMRRASSSPGATRRAMRMDRRMWRPSRCSTWSCKITARP